jgi:hypothetical protein
MVGDYMMGISRTVGRSEGFFFFFFSFRGTLSYVCYICIRSAVFTMQKVHFSHPLLRILLVGIF